MFPKCEESVFRTTYSSWVLYTLLPNLNIPLEQSRVYFYQMGHCTIPETVNHTDNIEENMLESYRKMSQNVDSSKNCMLSS